MKFSPLPLLLFASISFTSHANQVDQMVEFSISQMKHEGEFKGLSEFTGISASRLEEGLRTALTLCLNNNSFEDEKLLEACTRKEIPKSTGMSLAQMDAWGEAEDEMSPAEQIDEEVDRIDEKIFQLEDKNELTVSEEKELLKLENKRVQLYDKQNEIQMQELQHVKEMLSDLNINLKQ